MLARNQHLDEKNELTMCEFEKKKDLTKISAHANSRINFSSAVTSLSLGESIVFVLGFYVYFLPAL